MHGSKYLVESWKYHNVLKLKKFNSNFKKSASLHTSVSMQTQLAFEGKLETFLWKIKKNVQIKFGSGWTLQNFLSQNKLCQCRSMPVKILALIPMLNNSDQCRPILINADQCFTDALIQHWSALVGIDQHWEAFWINATILIGIDWHWSALGIGWGSLEYYSFLVNWTNEIKLRFLTLVNERNAFNWSSKTGKVSCLKFRKSHKYI